VRILKGLRAYFAQVRILKRLVASYEWRVASEKPENAPGAIPGKHTKSAQVIERKGDGFRSGAKERSRAKKRGKRGVQERGDALTTIGRRRTWVSLQSSAWPNYQQPIYHMFTVSSRAGGRACAVRVPTSTALGQDVARIHGPHITASTAASRNPTKPIRAARILSILSEAARCLFFARPLRVGPRSRRTPARSHSATDQRDSTKIRLNLGFRYPRPSLTCEVGPSNLRVNMPLEESVGAGNNLALEHYAEFRERHGQYIDHLAKAVDKGFDLNKQVSSFHERLILISLGTIGLSLTALTSFIPKIPGATFPMHTFVWYIVPAWILLFVSITYSRAVMGSLVLANSVLLEDWKTSADTYNIKQMWICLLKLSSTAQGTVKTGDKERSASAMFAEMADRVNKCVPEVDRVKIKSATEQLVSRIKIQSTIAVTSMQIGMILLCISAITLFLSL
jgi:hypothetical protein